MQRLSLLVAVGVIGLGSVCAAMAQAPGGASGGKTGAKAAPVLGSLTKANVGSLSSIRLAAPPAALTARSNIAALTSAAAPTAVLTSRAYASAATAAPAAGAAPIASLTSRSNVAAVSGIVPAAPVATLTGDSKISALASVAPVAATSNRVKANAYAAAAGTELKVPATLKSRIIDTQAKALRVK